MSISEPLSFEVLVGRIPAGGKQFSIVADEPQRRAVAEQLGILAVEALSAEIDVRPVGAEAFAVSGTLSAAIVQTDVVSLEPLRQEVNEAIDITLQQAAEDTLRKGRAASESAPEDLEDRDVYTRGRIDLGAIVVEHLALGLDPYPRSPGVEFPGHIEAPPEPKSSPFAALAPLKRDRE